MEVRRGMMLVCVGDNCFKDASSEEVERRFTIRNIAVDGGQRDRVN